MLSTDQSLTCITLVAGADLSASQYLFVALSTDGQIDTVVAAGGDAVGVLQDAPDAAGKAASVAVMGITRVVAGGAINPGALVRSSAAGKAVVSAASSTVLGRYIGTAACVDGEIISVLLGSHHVTGV